MWRRVLAIVLFVALLIGVFVAAFWPAITEYIDDNQDHAAGFHIGAPFTMINQDGISVTKKDFEGRALALFAGFTSCPDICPTTLTRLTSLIEKMGEDADKIQVVMFSVDPERDRPVVLKTYMASFDRRFMAITGTPEQTEKFAKDFRIYYKKVPGEYGSYTMNHSAGVLLFEKDGLFQGTLDLHEGDDVALRKLKMVAGK